jgi:hypothetical protein
MIESFDDKKSQEKFRSASQNVVYKVAGSKIKNARKFIGLNNDTNKPSSPPSELQP